MQSNLARHQNITSCRFEEFPRLHSALLRTIAPSSHPARLRDNFSELFKRLQDNLHFDHIGLGLYDADRNVVSVFLQAGEHAFPPEIPVIDSSLGLVVKQRQTIEVFDAENEIQFGDLARRAQSGGFKSFRIVPLITDRRTLGALAVVRRQPGHFSHDDVRYLDHAAELVALVLENALIADLLAREKAQLETLVDVNNALVSKLDVQALLREISNCIRRIVRHDYTHLALYEKPSDSMRFYVLNSESQPTVIVPELLVPLSECPAGIVFRQGEARLFKEADLQLIDSDYVRDLLKLGVRSVCCFPLTSRGRKLGTLGVLNLRQDLPTEHEMVLLTQIASQVAIAIDNARAYEEIAKFKEKLAKEKLYLEDEIRSQHNFDEVVGNSAALKDVLKQVEIAAPSDATVLLLGETGTGKELIARAVHRLSSRREGNFIKLNCAAIPTGLLESELFGHEKGAFTAPSVKKSAASNWLIKAQSFWTKSAKSRWNCNPSCYGSCRTTNSSASAA